MAEDKVPDLLIFRYSKEAQGKQPVQIPAPAEQKKELPKLSAPQAQKTEPQPQPAAKPAPAERPAEKKQAAQPEKVIAAAPIPKLSSLSMGDSIRLAKDQFCINHQWRHAYAICNFCKLPYCYVDIMEQDGKLYCVNDIESAKKNSGVITGEQSINSFSILASIIFVANSALLAYYTYPQILFVYQAALSSGISTFVLHLSQGYIFPIANAAIVLFGLIAAFSVTRKSSIGLAFALSVSFCSILMVLYEYLNSSVNYLFISTVLMLLSLSAVVYSRMSSVGEITEPSTLSHENIEWPTPEMY